MFQRQQIQSPRKLRSAIPSHRNKRQSYKCGWLSPGPDYILSRETPERSLSTHHHLVDELHPYRDTAPAVHDLGLGCGLPIVPSSSLLPYPGLLTRPLDCFQSNLVDEALGCSRNLTVSQSESAFHHTNTIPAHSHTHTERDRTRTTSGNHSIHFRAAIVTLQR